jgi:hypothetical protein
LECLSCCGIATFLNHYDHPDLSTLERLAKKGVQRSITALGNRDLIHSTGIAAVDELNGKKAEDFIRLCGSKSSVTGETYRMRFPDGTNRDAEVFFRERLKEFVADRSSRP